jgi:hypothetical protein
MNQPKNFAHRYAESGEIESICLSCFASIAGAKGTDEMVRNEGQHACEEQSSLSEFTKLIRVRAHCPSTAVVTGSA